MNKVRIIFDKLFFHIMMVHHSQNWKVPSSNFAAVFGWVLETNLITKLLVTFRLN